MQRQGKHSMLRALWATYCDFAANTGVHGLKYITEDGRRPWERVLWAAVVLSGLVGAGLMTATFWERFSTAPTRASVETNHYPAWRLPFPAATLCNVNRVFRSHAEALFDYIGAEGQERADAWETLPMMMELVQPQAANSSYRPGPARTLEALLTRAGISMREAMRLLDQGCDEMLERCMWQGEVVKCDELFEERKTYLGFCCSFNYRGVIETVDKNGKKSLQMGHAVPRHSRYYSHRMGLTVLINPMKYDYYLSSLYSAGIRMTVHRVDDYPDEAAEEKILPLEREMLVGVTLSSSYCTEAVRDLAPAVRGCVFPGERHLRFFPVYSATNCLTECRMNYSAKFCGCSPFYYHEIGEVPICTFKHIPCLNQYYFALRRRRASMGKLVMDAGKNVSTASIDCDCPPLCSQVNYDVHVSSGDFKAARFHRSRLLDGANVTGRTLLHFYLMNSVSVRFKRDVVSSWSDLLSSLGGVFSLCLGFSVLSVIEVVYFFTMRLALRYRLLATPPGSSAAVVVAPSTVAVEREPKFLTQPVLKGLQPYSPRIGPWEPPNTASFSVWKNQF